MNWYKTALQKLGDAELDLGAGSRMNGFIDELAIRKGSHWNATSLATLNSGATYP